MTNLNDNLHFRYSNSRNKIMYIPFNHDHEFDQGDTSDIISDFDYHYRLLPILQSI